jgi:hypothetical protein
MFVTLPGPPHKSIRCDILSDFVRRSGVLGFIDTVPAHKMFEFLESE